MRRESEKDVRLCRGGGGGEGGERISRPISRRSVNLLVGAAERAAMWDAACTHGSAGAQMDDGDRRPNESHMPGQEQRDPHSLIGRTCVALIGPTVARSRGRGFPAATTSLSSSSSRAVPPTPNQFARVAVGGSPPPFSLQLVVIGESHDPATSSLGRSVGRSAGSPGCGRSQHQLISAATTATATADDIDSVVTRVRRRNGRRGRRRLRSNPNRSSSRPS